MKYISKNHRPRRVKFILNLSKIDYVMYSVLRITQIILRGMICNYVFESFKQL